MFNCSRLGLVVGVIVLVCGFVPNPNWLNAQEQGEAELAELFRSAQLDLESEAFAAAAKKLKKYTAADDSNTQAWFFLGYSLHMDGKLDEAIEAHKKATKDPDLGPVAIYNLGCAYSLKNEPKKSLEYLHEALDAGFSRFEMFSTDQDLANVRKVDGFQEIMERAANNGRPVEKTTEIKGLAGKWVITSGQRAGEDVGSERLPPEITFTKKDVTIPAGPDQFVMSYKVVDDSKDVIKVDFKIESGPAPEGSALAILKLKGNQATLCYDPTGASRPEKFESTEDNGFFLFVMEKKDKPVAEEKADGNAKMKQDNLAKDMLGKWNVTSGVRAGEPVTPERLDDAVIDFRKTEIIIPLGDEQFVMSYTLDTSGSPAEIDMKIESGPAPAGSQAIGIIQMKDGKLWLCYDASGATRPEAFESTSDNAFFFFTMERVKE